MEAQVFDLHVHSAPDVSARLADDVTTVGWYAESGFSGCVLKGHYEPTVGRARAAGTGRGLAVFGGVALNHPAGGLNPVAVEAALRMGARVVWMPTVDCHTQRSVGLVHPMAGVERLTDVTYAIPPVDWTAEKAVRKIIDLVVAADAVIATGHVSTEEAGWLVEAAVGAGARRVLLTHPSYTVPAMTAADARALTELGAYAEVTAYQLLHQPGCSIDHLAQFVSTVGYDRVVLSSDAGQPDSPPPPQALARLVDALVGRGLDREAVHAMADDIPRRLVQP